jgi:RNA polymerase I-specific transcription initiation factor RRN7
LLHYQEQEKDEDQNLPTEAEDENRSDNSETSDDETDPEMDALLRELSEASSSEGEGIDLDPAPIKNIHKRKRRGTYDFPANNIAILMLACWTLRIPVLYMDFIRYPCFMMFL